MKHARNVSKPTIVLIRHGKPLFDDESRYQSGDWPELIRAYDNAGLEAKPKPASLVADVVFSSDLRRAIETAAALFPSTKCTPDNVFREAALTTTLPAFASGRFGTLAALSRVLWMLGAASSERYTVASDRARSAADVLEQASVPGRTVVLVGHGFQNRLIRRELRQRGWRASGSGGGYLSTVTLV